MDEHDPTELPDDPRAARLAEFAAKSRTRDDASPCPDAGLVAGLAEGRLLPAEQVAVESHLVACDACRAAVADLVRDRAPVLPAARRPAGKLRRPLRLAIPAAAAVLVAAASWALLHGSGTAGTDEALVASARDLATSRPDLFRGFEPLHPDEAIARAPAPNRGALALFSPAGKVLETRPAYRWETVPGVTLWHVTLRTADGETIWTADASAAEFAFPAARPELTAGTRYIWEAAGEGPLGPERSSRAFDVASAGERRDFDDAVREIGERVPSRLQTLVRAHFALRHGFHAAARDAAAEFVRENPKDPAGRAALAAADRALGLPGAEGDSR